VGPPGPQGASRTAILSTVIVSHEHRFIFVKTRKTAGTSIEVALSALAGEDAIVTPVQPREDGHRPRNWRRPFNPVPELIDQYVRHEPAIAHRRLKTTFGELGRRQAFRNHLPAALIRDRVGRKLWDRYFTFCFERDPWDKTVSWYFYVTRKDPDRPPFEEWARTAALPTDWDLYTIGGTVGVDFVGRYEQLDADLSTALRQVGISDSPALPRAKGQLRPAGITDLSPAVEERIREVFENERKEFGYERPAVT
jgi:hypothetical protein